MLKSLMSLIKLHILSLFRSICTKCTIFDRLSQRTLYALYNVLKCVLFVGREREREEIGGNSKCLFVLNALIALIVFGGKAFSFWFSLSLVYVVSLSRSLPDLIKFSTFQLHTRTSYLLYMYLHM